MDTFYPEISPRFAAFLAQLGTRPIAVVGHARPDGDCIGSQVALSRVLAALGHEVVCVNPDAVPRRLQFLTNELTFLRPGDLPPREYTAIFVDCADHDRAGEQLKTLFPSPFGNIDHHLSATGFAQHNFVDPASAATAELLAGMLLDNGLAIDAVVAQGLYVGILTDTGQFRFNSTSRRSFLLAAELFDRGAKPAEAGYELYEREAAGKLRLLQRFLASLRLEANGRICIGLLPNGVFAETGSTSEDTEGVVDYARAIEGVDIGALLEERADGIKASLRSKDPVYRLDRVAAQFGGGGHACAAGLNVKGETAATFYPRLLAALTAQLQSAGAGR